MNDTEEKSGKKQALPLLPLIGSPRRTRAAIMPLRVPRMLYFNEKTL